MEQFDLKSFAEILIRHMDEAICVENDHGEMVYVNPKFCELLGYSPEEVVGKSVDFFCTPESAKVVREINETKREKGVSSRYHCDLVDHSGKNIPVIICGSALPGGGTMGVMTDVREIKTRESLHQRLVEHMNEAVWMGDAEGKTIYANPKFYELLGYSPEDVVGKCFREFWDKAGAKWVKEIHEKERKEEVGSSYEGNLITKEGLSIPVLLNGTSLEGGGMIEIMTDLRELKRKDQNEKIFSRAVESSSNAVMVLDEDGKIYSWNQGARRMLGYREEEVKGKSLEQVFQGEDAKALIESAEESVYNVELQALHKHGSKVPISANFAQIYDQKNQKMPFHLLVARDITHRLKVEEEIALKHQKIKDAYHELGTIRRQMDYVFEFLDFSNTHKDLQSLADYVVNSSMMLTRVDACIFRVYDEKTKNLELVSHFGFAAEWQGKKSIPLKGGLLEKALNQGGTLKILDLASEMKYSTPTLARKYNLCSLLLIPITFQGKLLGSLSLYTTHSRKLEIFENDFIEKYGQLIGCVLAKAN